MTATDPRRAIDAVFRIESPQLIASLARMTGDIGLAEDFAQDALVAALQQWPADGIPDRPGAWLMATSKRRAIDHFRRNKVAEHKLSQVARLQEPEEQPEDWPEPRVGDDLLRLIMICCHTILPVDSRVALTLRLLGGLSTREIARGFLASEPTVAQRIVRAKRTLAEARVPFEVPEGAELNQRLDSVLRVLYLVFNEGYSSTSARQWVRPSLCEDALRMGRVLAELVPDEPEVHALVALMEIQASRIKARIDESGRPVLLADQNRARWDRLLISRGLSALDRAEKLGGPTGPYRLQAAIASCHATAPAIEQTDWERITSLYEQLVMLTGSPVVELNHAVALGMANGPEAGLEAVNRLRDEPALRSYPLLHGARGDLLEKLGRLDEAGAEFNKAAELAQNDQERQLMLDRARACGARNANPNDDEPS